MGSAAEYFLLLLGLASVPIGLLLLGAAIFWRDRKTAVLGFIALAIATSVFVRVRYAQFWAIDACLDQGGSFDYEMGQCEED